MWNYKSNSPFLFQSHFCQCCIRATTSSLWHTVGVHIHVYAFNCRGQRSSSGFLPQVPYTLIFKVDFSWLGPWQVHNLAGQQAQVSTFPGICLWPVLFKYRTLVVIMIRYFWDCINIFQWSRVGFCACHSRQHGICLYFSFGHTHTRTQKK